MALLWTVAPACAYGQAAHGAPAIAPEDWRAGLPVFAAADVRADLDTLYASLARAHYDLFARVAEDDYRRLHAELSAEITRALDAVDVAALFQRFVAFGRVAHAQVPFPDAGFGAYVQDGGRLLPFDVRFEDDRVVVARTYAGVMGLVAGSELVAIDGQPIVEWLVRASSYVSADRDYLRDALLELHLPRLLWLAGMRSEQFELTVRDTSGDRRVVQVVMRPAREVLARRWEWQRTFMERRARMLPGAIAYLRPGPFFDIESGTATYDASAFRTFVDSTFSSFIAAGARELIIDLRANPGGDNSFSDPLLAWIADRPFRFVSTYAVRASGETRASVASMLEQYPGLTSLRRMHELLTATPDGERVPFDVPMVQPRNDRFRGRVWVLVDRHTYSNATAVAATIQDYGFGTIAGEETADLPTTYGSAAQFTLPRTGISVVYPKGFLVRPSGGRELRGVVPDVELGYEGIPDSDADAVLEQLRQLVIERRAQGGRNRSTQERR